MPTEEMSRDKVNSSGGWGSQRSRVGGLGMKDTVVRTSMEKFGHDTDSSWSRALATGP